MMMEERKEKHGAGGKVLVVHPDAQLRAALRETLESQQYHCAVFATGQEALDECEPSLLGAVVLGLDLPDHNALALGYRFKELVGKRAFLPVLVVGDAASVERRLLERASGDLRGCDDFLTTPLCKAELVVRLASQIARRDAHDELLQRGTALEREQERRRKLAALVVHDLRNPLSAIAGNVQLLTELIKECESKLDPMTFQCLGDLDELSTRTLSMVGRILDVEELEEGRLKASQDDVDVHRFVSRMPSFYKTAIEARSLVLTIHCPDTLHARFDRHLIARIVENLLDNAVRYAPRAGRVVLSVLVDQDDLVIEVGNNGPAIPKEEQDKMFERYYQLEGQHKGTRANRGLGLYFCRLAAQAHDGTITVTSRPDLPACFVLRLPRAVEALANAAAE